MPGETSPTSSSSSVPPLAASNRPGRSCVAPVNAPRAWPNSSLSSSVSVMAPQLTAMNGPAARVDSSWTSRAIRSLPEPLSPVMSTVESTLATRRARSTTCRIAGLLATIPSGSSTSGATRTSARRCSRSFRSAAFSVSVTRCERDVEALLEPLRLEEAQLLGALVAPLLARAADQVAGRVALAHAAVLEDVDLLADAAADVAAGEPADGPAHRRVGATEVQEVLLRLVGGDEHHALLGERSLAAGLDAEQALERVDAGARAPPVVVAVPLELGLHRLGHAPAVREAELGEHGARGGEAEVLDQVLAQQPHRHRVEQERALPGEADHAALRVQLQQLFVVQIVRAHATDTIIRIE